MCPRYQSCFGCFGFVRRGVGPAEVNGGWGKTRSHLKTRLSDSACVTGKKPGRRHGDDKSAARMTWIRQNAHRWSRTEAYVGASRTAFRRLLSTAETALTSGANAR